MSSKKELFKKAKPHPGTTAIYNNMQANDPNFGFIASGLYEEHHKQLGIHKALVDPYKYQEDRNNFIKLLQEDIARKAHTMVDTIRQMEGKNPMTGAISFGIGDAKKQKEYVAAYSRMLAAIYDQVLEYKYPAKLAEIATQSAMLENKAKL